MPEADCRPAPAPGRHAHGAHRRRAARRASSLAGAAGSDLREPVFREVLARGWTLLELTPRQASLEDVFVRLVSRDAAADVETLPGVRRRRSDARGRNGEAPVSALKAFFAIVKREFFSYFVSPLAYVVLTAFLLDPGLRVLRCSSWRSNQPETPRTALMSLFFTNVFYWIFMMLVSSIIAMRLLSEERKSGSIETLLTAPVSEATVVAGEVRGRAGASSSSSGFRPLSIRSSSRASERSTGVRSLAGYLGIALIGALFISAGTFASALTKNQIVAAILAFVLILGIFIIGVVPRLPAGPRVRATRSSYLNLLEHMDDFARGIVDTRRLLYVVSTVVFFLFLSTRALEANKGR